MVRESQLRFGWMTSPISDLCLPLAEQPELFPARSAKSEAVSGARGPGRLAGAEGTEAQALTDLVLKVARCPAESPPFPNWFARVRCGIRAPPRGARVTAGPAAESGAGTAQGPARVPVFSPAGRVWPGVGALPRARPGSTRRGEAPLQASTGVQTREAGEDRRSLPVPRTTLSLGSPKLVGPEDFL